MTATAISELERANELEKSSEQLSPNISETKEEEKSVASSTSTEGSVSRETVMDVFDGIMDMARKKMMKVHTENNELTIEEYFKIWFQVIGTHTGADRAQSAHYSRFQKIIFDKFKESVPVELQGKKIRF